MCKCFMPYKYRHLVDVIYIYNAKYLKHVTCERERAYARDVLLDFKDKLLRTNL